MPDNYSQTPDCHQTADCPRTADCHHTADCHQTPVLRLDPEERLCPAYDSVTIARYPVARPGEMGFRVLDNFCEEHIQ